MLIIPLCQAINIGAKRSHTDAHEKPDIVSFTLPADACFVYNTGLNAVWRQKVKTQMLINGSARICRFHKIKDLHSTRRLGLSKPCMTFFSVAQDMASSGCVKCPNYYGTARSELSVVMHDATEI